MKPFFVLFAAFIAAILIFFFFTGSFNESVSGRIALSIMLLFTALGHFKFADGMAMMIPDFIPHKKFTVYITGLIELLFCIMIHLEPARFHASLGLIIFLILVFPANINAAFSKVHIEKANYEGPGTSYLWFRIPMQFVLLFWIWIFCM